MEPVTPSSEPQQRAADVPSAEPQQAAFRLPTSDDPPYDPRFSKDPFDPMFVGEPLPDYVPDLSGATIEHIALDCNLRVSLSSGWRASLEAPTYVVMCDSEPKLLEFIYGVLPDDKYLTPELRQLVGQPVTEMLLASESNNLALITPRGRITVAGWYGLTPWELWGPEGHFVDGGDRRLHLPD